MPHLLSMNSYHYRRGGSDVVYFDHAGLFEEMGWQNTFFSMAHPKNLASPDSRHFARLVDHEYAQGAFDKLRTAAASIYNFDARRQARKLVAANRFDIAHAHCIYHHLTPSVFEVCASAGVPVVLTAHDLKLACPAYKMMNGGSVCEACRGGDLTNVARNRCIKGSLAASLVVMAEAYVHRALDSYGRYVSKVVAPSRFYRDKLIEWGIPSAKIRYIPNFTRTLDAGRHRQSYGDPILYFGRLSEEKGLATLIRSSALSKVPVAIAGQGPIEPQLRALAIQLDAPVTFLGRLDGDQLWGTVGRARAIVIPSEWYENAPMSVLESFQLERPVIGARIGGIPELIDTDIGRCGWLYRSGDVAALARTLEEVSQTCEQDLLELGRRGRELAMGRFSKSRYYTAMSELYASCR